MSVTPREHLLILLEQWSFPSHWKRAWDAVDAWQQAMAAMSCPDGSAPTSIDESHQTTVDRCLDEMHQFAADLPEIYSLVRDQEPSLLGEVPVTFLPWEWPPTMVRPTESELQASAQQVQRLSGLVRGRSSMRNPKLSMRYASLFRREAERFSRLEVPSPWEPSADGHRVFNPQRQRLPYVNTRLIEHCGRLLIEAERHGLWPEGELRQAIAWHTADSTGDPKPGKNGVAAVRVRCPFNLWLDVAGGHEVIGRVKDGKVEVEIDPTTGTDRAGGILPKEIPGLLRLPDHERYAEVCKALADLIEGREKIDADSFTQKSSDSSTRADVSSVAEPADSSPTLRQRLTRGRFVRMIDRFFQVNEELGTPEALELLCASTGWTVEELEHKPMNQVESAWLVAKQQHGLPPLPERLSDFASRREGVRAVVQWARDAIDSQAKRPSWGSYQRVMTLLWNRWRQCFPDEAPPPEPAVSDAIAAHNATDALLRILNALADPAARIRPSATHDSPVRFAALSPIQQELALARSGLLRIGEMTAEAMGMSDWMIGEDGLLRSGTAHNTQTAIPAREDLPVSGKKLVSVTDHQCCQHQIDLCSCEFFGAVGPAENPIHVYSTMFQSVRYWFRIDPASECGNFQCEEQVRELFREANRPLPVGLFTPATTTTTTTTPDCAPSQQVGNPLTPVVKAKRSTERGEGQAKIIAALTEHHQYADGGCLNLEPIGNNALARKAGVSKSAASGFFTEQFQGHAKYRAACGDASLLVSSLKILNGELSPHILYGRNPPGEGGSSRSSSGDDD